MNTSVEDALKAMRQAGEEIERLRRVNNLLEEALLEIVDSGLLMGPTVLHEKINEAARAAIAAHCSTRYT